MKGSMSMNVAEIILLLLGFASISISFFMGNKEQPETEKATPGEEETSKSVWTRKEEEIVQERIRSILNKEKEEILAETAEALSRRSNEKIMEFDEFSRQLLEKINHNHEEVVFMYNMLSEKEKEWKEEAARPVKKEPLPEKIAEAAAEEEDVRQPEEANAEAGQTEEKETGSQAETLSALAAPVKKQKTESGSAGPAAPAAGGINDRMIKLYREGKSVLEISKELNVGQGEVRLTIALYGGNR